MSTYANHAAAGSPSRRAMIGALAAVPVASVHYIIPLNIGYETTARICP